MSRMATSELCSFCHARRKICCDIGDSHYCGACCPNRDDANHRPRKPKKKVNPFAQPSDPTYITADIEDNPAWKLAFWLSEVDNQHAPLGWSRYIPLATCLLATFDMRKR